VFDLRGCTTLKIGKLLGQLLVVVNIGFSLAIGTPELIPDPILWMIAHTPHSVGSGISDLTVTVQGGYPTIINIGCYPLIPDPWLISVS